MHTTPYTSQAHILPFLFHIWGELRVKETVKDEFFRVRHAGKRNNREKYYQIPAHILSIHGIWRIRQNLSNSKCIESA